MLTGTRLLIKPAHLARTQEFYSQHAGKTIIIARFVPNLLYNVIGGVLWAGVFIGGGYLCGNLPLVRENFEFAIAAIGLVSAMPIAIEAAHNHWGRRSTASA